jgi:glutamate synthase domain-containing protein 1
LLTFPCWERAQPYRFLAHNGEVTTLRGNLNLVRSREGLPKSDIQRLEKLFPIVDPHGSDSMGLDNCLAFMLMEESRSLPETVMMLVTEA